MYYSFLKGEGKERRDELGKTTVGDTGIPRKRPHRGNDWGFENGSLGKPVYAVASGVVTKVFISNELQGCITVKNDHDGVYVTTCHHDPKSFQVKKGDKVIGGETHLANIGPYKYGPHLHACASKEPSPTTCDPSDLLDLFKLMDADKAKRDALKPKSDTPAKKAAAKKPAAKKVAK